MVFVVGDVADPVDLVLDRPVPADLAGQMYRFRLVDAEIGDGVDGLGGETSRLVQAASAAADLDGVGGVREVDAGGDRQDFQAADLAAAVSAVGVAGGVGDCPPGQCGELGVQVGLVAFDGQDQWASRSTR
ncbi:hypothetical protein [Micromonospora arborensis]|uniref:hypothetical protein n=1 Tax=Micromonospora arborensis TaxID=2116518 RepID=UPI00371AF57F